MAEYQTVRRFQSLLALALAIPLTFACTDERKDAGPPVSTSAIGDGSSVGLPLRSAAREVSVLRAELAATTREYATALTARIPADLAPTVDRLRRELAQANIQAVHELTSSDVVLATLRATVDHKRDLINAYEEVAGHAGSGPKTTELNVHTSAELVSMQKEVRAALASVEKARQAAPASIALDVRWREVEGVLVNIDAELAARQNDAGPKLMAIDPAVTIDQARERSTSIKAIESNGFRHHLRIQVELRSQSNPQDPHLAVLQKQLSRGPPNGTDGGPLGPDDPWIPSPRVPKPPRPPPSSAEATVERLVAATHDELTALERGDLTQLARARARVTAYSHWLRTVAGQVADVSELAVLTDDQLLNSLERYSRFLAADELSPSITEVRWKRKIASVRHTEILKEVERRALSRREALDAGESLIHRIAETPPTAQQLASERRMGASIAHEEAMEARKLADMSSPLPSRSLNALAANSQTESLRSDARLLAAGWDDLQLARRDLLISGRGEAVGQRARAITDAESTLRSAAATLQERIAAVNGGLETESKLLRRFALRGNPVDVHAALVKVELIRAGGFHTEKVVVEITRADIAAEAHREADRIEVVAGHIPSPADKAAAPKEFNELFPATEQWTKSEGALLENLRRAPGGVIIDASLQDPIASKIEEARVDPNSGRIDVRVGRRWRHLKPEIPPSAVRAAWAYVTLGSAVAVDLRPLDPEEVSYLVSAYAPEHLFADEKLRLAQMISGFTSVNLNPAMVSTKIGNDLIATDQLIFDLLPLEGVRDEKSDAAAGLDIPGLRDEVMRDRRSLLSDPSLWSRTYKSIVTLSHVAANIDEDEVVLRPTIHFLVAAVPAQGTARAAGVTALLLRRSSAWFDRNTPQLLANYGPLRAVSEFACVTAVLRAVAQTRIPNNFDLLGGLQTGVAETPRFLCRARTNRDCTAASLHQLFDRH